MAFFGELPISGALGYAFILRLQIEELEGLTHKAARNEAQNKGDRGEVLKARHATCLNIGFLERVELAFLWSLILLIVLDISKGIARVIVVMMILLFITHHLL